MTLQLFLSLLCCVSTLTSLCTEAVKNWLTERGKSYHANAMAGYIATILSVLVGIAYVVFFHATVSTELIVYIVALVLCSWLAAMVGYDKVVQAIQQFQKYE